MLVRRQRLNVPFDMRIDAFVNQRYTRGMADQEESRMRDDAGIHGGAPFDSQAEPELRLAAKGATVAADCTMARTVHGTKRSSESFGRPVPVPHRDREKIIVADHIGR